MNHPARYSLIATMVWCLTLSVSVAYAEDNINTIMAKAAGSLSDLIPLAYNDDAFRAEQHRKAISEQLAQLNTLFTHKAQLLGKQSDTAWITLKVLQDHLAETESLYNAGYYAMSQYLLTSTPAICSTCHIQDSAHSSIQTSLTRDSFANDYSYAEYLFTVRNYDLAQQYYQSHLQLADVKQSRFRYLKPLERLLTIELGIRQSIAKAKMLLTEHHKRTKQIEIKQVISEWLQGVSSINAAGINNHQQLVQLYDQWFANTPNNSHEFIMDEAKRPKAIWLRAKLYEALNKKQSKEQSSQTLYMLAVIDRILGQDEPYSFANLYLKQCVVKYPKTSSAKRCLDEYKNHLSFYYGGSAGEAVPEELVNEYQEMKAHIESAN